MIKSIDKRKRKWVHAVRKAYESPPDPKRFLRIGSVALAVAFAVTLGLGAAPDLRVAFKANKTAVLRNEMTAKDDPEAGEITVSTRQNEIISESQSVSKIAIDLDASLTILPGTIITMVPKYNALNNDTSKIDLDIGSTLDLYGTLTGQFNALSLPRNASFNVYLCDGARFDASYNKDQNLLTGSISYYGYNAGTNGHGTVSVQDDDLNDITDQSVGSGDTLYTYIATPESSSYNTIRWTMGDRVIGDGTTVRVKCEENAKNKVIANFLHTHSYGYPVWTWDENHEATATFSCTDIHCPDEDGRIVTQPGAVSSVVTDPTCTDDRTTTYTASVEFNENTYTTMHEDILVITDSGTALGHDWGEWDVTPATCTQDGEQTRTCLRDSSHTETQTIEAPGHDWGDWEVTTPATCTQDGEQTRTCLRDSSHTETQTIEAPGHDWGDWEVTTPATCTEEGEKKRACQRDGCTETETGTVPAPGHSLTRTEAKAATCDAPGNTEYWTCRNCGKIFSDADAINEITVEATVIPALDHSLTKTEAKAATCDVPGNTEYWTCRNCGRIFSEDDAAVEIAIESTVIPAPGHDWGEWEVTTPATCTEEGEQTRTCRRDSSHTETQTIEARGHDWGDWEEKTPATCTEEGEQTRTCRRDSSHTETQTIEARGHDWGEWKVIQEPTVTEEGSRRRQCNNDPTHIQTEAIPATGGGYRFVPDGTADQDVSTAKDPTYQWKKKSGKDLLFVVKNASDDSQTSEKFQKVLVNGEEIDSSKYTAAAGSLRLTLKAGYLQTLSEGEHTLTVQFTDGTISHTFRILPASADSDSPGTGENGMAVAISAVMLVLAAAGAAYVVIRRRKAIV